MDSTVDALQEAVIAKLNRLVKLLDDHAQYRWSNWFRDSLEMIKEGNSTGIDRIISAYGGMGSFGDLILEKVDTNEELNSLRVELWNSTSELKRSLR